MTTPHLQLRAVGKRLGSTEVLDAVSLEVRAGEFVSILGPSGAGKSTILNLLIGALTADRGQILVDGQPLGRQPPFAYMPQRDALLPWRRVLDNATLGLEVMGSSRRAARQAVAPLLQEFGLAGFEAHYPAQLSGGMRQRVALLRTVAQQRGMLLLDEPLGALDALTRARMQAWLAEMRLRHGWTVLLISHDVRETVQLSDRIYVLSRRPARVLREFAVPFPHPRPPTGSPALAALEAEILAELFKLEP